MRKIGGRTFGDYLIDIDLQKVEFFGDEYIMQYMLLRYRNESKEKVYKAYVTDTLKVIAENTARYAGGSTIKKRYIDISEEEKNEPQKPQKSAEKVKNYLLEKMKKDFGR